MMTTLPRDVLMTIFSLAFSVPVGILHGCPSIDWASCARHRRVLDELEAHPWFVATRTVSSKKAHWPSDVRYLYLTGLLDAERIQMERSRRFRRRVSHKWVGHGHWSMPVTVLVDPVGRMHILIQDRVLVTWAPRR